MSPPLRPVVLPLPGRRGGEGILFCPLANCVPETSQITIPAPFPIYPLQSPGGFLEAAASLLSFRGHIPLQETMREKIFTPLTVESAVDAR